MSRRHTVVDSPVGELTLVAEGDDLVGIYMEDQRHHPGLETFGPRDGHGFDHVADQLGEYFEGERTAFDVPLRLAGTEFQRKVWRELLEIPAGETRTYGQLAAVLGRPTASRAVGLANGKNPISIIVPCHRVVGANGSLTGYGGGLPRKRFLLELERGGGLF
ncbi:methylated-DNA--[protein]-cysteine S-methyltransferase [Phytomonospora sp. NPDC050363]|uniref:methylated-DNA--[protein]-cysteine S-methyltransferase n=1 Tax=Phytomonospora sp. NPDC050363 TaxID=3155642 RepID=UPI0033C83CB9